MANKNDQVLISIEEKSKDDKCEYHISRIHNNKSIKLEFNKTFANEPSHCQLTYNIETRNLVFKNLSPEELPKPQIQFSKILNLEKIYSNFQMEHLEDHQSQISKLTDINPERIFKRITTNIILIDSNGKTLQTKRSSKNKNDAWVYPGGGVDAGESLEQGACRELFEEVGCQISDETVLIPFCIHEGNLPVKDLLNNDNKNNRHTLTIFYIAFEDKPEELIKLDYIPGGEVADHKWVDLKFLIGNIDFDEENANEDMKSLTGVYPNKIGQGLAPIHYKTTKMLENYLL